MERVDGFPRLKLNFQSYIIFLIWLVMRIA